MAKEVLTRKKLTKRCNENLAFRTCKYCPKCLEGERSCIRPVTHKSSEEKKKEALSLFDSINCLPDCLTYYNMQ